MTDKSTTTSFLDGKTAITAKRTRAHQRHECEGCPSDATSAERAIPVGTAYVRVQFVAQRPGEDLSKPEQARAVDYQRRVISKFHPRCLPPEMGLGPSGSTTRRYS